MKYIKKDKNTEPESLIKYRKTAKPTYENYRNKEELRKTLLEEQGYLCAYCMKKIENDELKTKIEHYLPRNGPNKRPDLQLEYSNLLAVCNGGQGQKRHKQHCDTKKGSALITINPTLAICEKQIKYRKNGTIFAEDSAIQNDVDTTLNLNLQPLKDNRAAVLEIAIERLKKKSGNSWTRELIEKEIQFYQTKTKITRKPKNQKKPVFGFHQYCQIIIYYLKNKLK